jgi:GNAT superfamily N-acetyltransferase
MASCKIDQCTVLDAAALAHNNISAFWEDPTWRILWPSDITLEYLIGESTKRQANNLLRSPEDTRHQKSVDPVTGAVLGYARWILPPSSLDEWPEAKVPAVSEKEKKQIQKLAESAWWQFRSDMDHLDDEGHQIKNRILAEKPYMSRFWKTFILTSTKLIVGLDYLAVHPNNKRKGIATALVESGIQQANRLGLPIFIWAFQAGHGVYKRLGFKEVDRVIKGISQFGCSTNYAVYFMVYDQKDSIAK